jgi:hypothetical protein
MYIPSKMPIFDDCLLPPIDVQPACHKRHAVFSRNEKRLAIIIGQKAERIDWTSIAAMS